MIDLKNIPKKPGVYIMKNTNDEIIYIGKAKNLKNRVSSYFNNPNSSLKTFELVKNIKNIDFFITNTEIEALILENNLIKKHKPKYNILLKDNKTYPYLKVTIEKFPKLSIVRSTKHLNDDTKSYYFGPFPMNSKNIINMLLTAFDIKKYIIDIYNKKISINNLRKSIKMEDLVFFDKESEEKYLKDINNMIDFLKNKDKSMLDKLKNEIDFFSENLEFEKALELKKRLDILNKLIDNQIIEIIDDKDEDYIYIKEKNGIIFVAILSMIEGKIIDKNIFEIEKNIFFDNYENILISYYFDRKVPKDLIINSNLKNEFKLIVDWFKEFKNKKVRLNFPLIKSRRYDLLDLSKKNLEIYMENYFNKESNIRLGLIELKNKLGLKEIPKLIESVDISNLGNEDIVGAVISFLNGKKYTKNYKKFKIKSINKADDYTSMREVIYRRLKYGNLPDLILLDGGKNHVSIIKKLLKEENINIDVFGLYKDENHITKGIVSENKYYDISKESMLYNLIYEIQEEVHRFVIEYNKKLRKERIIKSKLDEITGIGPKRKKELIKKFGNVKNIFEADLYELTKIIPLKVALEIKNK